MTQAAASQGAGNERVGDEGLGCGLGSIVERAGRFELGALLRVLLSRGFDWNTLRFEGVQSLQPLQGPLVRSLRFEGQAPAVAIIGLNAGLLWPGAPLPNYFGAFARGLPDATAFVHFIGFWDSALLYNLAYSTHPSLAADASRSIPKAQVARLGTHSKMWVHWLFRSMFPELGVRVRRRNFQRSQVSGEARVGVQLDGRCVLGSSFSQSRPGFQVQLRAESECAHGVEDWEGEALARLSMFEQTLRRANCLLEVLVEFESYRHGQALSAVAGARRQLGVRPWTTARSSQSLGPGRVLLRQPWPDAS